MISSYLFFLFFILAPRHTKATHRDSLSCAFRRVFFFLIFQPDIQRPTGQTFVRFSLGAMSHCFYVRVCVRVHTHTHNHAQSRTHTHTHTHNLCCVFCRVKFLIIILNVYIVYICIYTVSQYNSQYIHNKHTYVYTFTYIHLRICIHAHRIRG
jgi:hypothetical protein